MVAEFSELEEMPLSTQTSVDQGRVSGVSIADSTVSSDASLLHNDNSSFSDSEQSSSTLSSQGASTDSAEVPFCSFQSPKLFVTCLAGAWLVESALASGYTNSALSSLERRFGLSSSHSGFIVSSYEVMALVSTLFVAYWGGKGHRPRWIGCMTLIIGVGSFLFTLPHFLAPYYYVQEDLNATDITPLCELEKEEQKCLPNASFDWGFPLFIIANFFVGCGTSAMIILGPTYIQDGVSRRSFPLYTGIIYATAAFGPAFGFFMGAGFTKIFVNPDTWPTYMSEKNSKWVGAWWIGYLVFGGLHIIAAIPFFFFPRNLPRRKDTNNKAYVAYLNERSSDEDDDTTLASFGKNFKDMFSSLLIFLRNPVWLLVSLGFLLMTACLTGIITFIAKYLTATYGFSASRANVFTGIVIAPSACLGVFFGGLILRRFQFDFVRTSGLILIYGALSIVGVIILMVIRCPAATIAGIHLPYGNISVPADWVRGDDPVPSQCNLGCGCDLLTFDPVCGVNDITYYSPCYAGCTMSQGDDVDVNQVHYYHCSCVDPIPSDQPFTNTSRKATSGSCQQCDNYIIIFFVMLFITTFVTCLGHNACILIILRYVPKKLRSFSLGVNTFIVRLLAQIPAPMVFGAMLDTQCQLWQSPQLQDVKTEEVCGSNNSGVCLVYDSHHLPQAMFGLTLIMQIAAFLCFAVAHGILRYRQYENVDSLGENKPAGPKVHFDLDPDDQYKEEIE